MENLGKSGTLAWGEPLLDELGRLYLLARSFERFDELSPETRGDLYSAIGCRELLAEATREPLRDQWMVLGLRLKRLRDRSSEHLN